MVHPTFGVSWRWTNRIFSALYNVTLCYIFLLTNWIPYHVDQPNSLNEEMLPFLLDYFPLPIHHHGILQVFYIIGSTSPGPWCTGLPMSLGLRKQISSGATPPGSNTPLLGSGKHGPETLDLFLRYEVFGLHCIVAGGIRRCMTRPRDRHRRYGRHSRM